MRLGPFLTIKGVTYKQKNARILYVRFSYNKYYIVPY